MLHTTLSEAQKFCACSPYKNYWICCTEENQYIIFPDHQHDLPLLSGELPLPENCLSYCREKIDEPPITAAQVLIWRDICEFLKSWGAASSYLISIHVPSAAPLLEKLHRHKLFIEHGVSLIKWDPRLHRWQLTPCWNTDLETLQQIYLPAPSLPSL